MIVGFGFVLVFALAVLVLSAPRFIAYRFAGPAFFPLCWMDAPGSRGWHLQDFRELAALVSKRP